MCSLKDRWEEKSAEQGLTQDFMQVDHVELALC